MMISQNNIALGVIKAALEGNVVAGVELNDFNELVVTMEGTESIIISKNALAEWLSWGITKDKEDFIVESPTQWTITADKEYVLTKQDLEDIVVGAFETGIGHWAGISNMLADGTTITEHRPVGKDLAFSEIIFQLLLDGKGVVVYDIEDTTEMSVLTLPKLLEGIKKQLTGNLYPKSIDDMDAEDYDCIVQYALFKEIVYG